MTKKLIYEALERDLGKKIAKEAAELFDAEFFDNHKHKEVDLAKPSSILKAAFSWHKTKRGYAYWYNMCNKLD